MSPDDSILFFFSLQFFFYQPLSYVLSSCHSTRHVCGRKRCLQTNLGPRPSLMLVICQDKPIPLVRSSLRINSSFPFPLCSFVPTVVPILERKIETASAYINIIKSELFLMRLCESVRRFLWTEPLTRSSCHKFLRLVSEIGTDIVLR